MVSILISTIMIVAVCYRNLDALVAIKVRTLRAQEAHRYLASLVQSMNLRNLTLSFHDLNPVIFYGEGSFGDVASANRCGAGFARRHM